MKRGDPLKYWNWWDSFHLSLKSGVIPMGLYVYYNIRRREFVASPVPTSWKIQAKKIDDSAVAEALAVSLTYEVAR